MENRRKTILILFLLLLSLCSCSMEHAANEAAGLGKAMEELAVEIMAAGEPEEMPAIVFLFKVEFYEWRREKDANSPRCFFSFIDNRGNVYALTDAYVNGLTYLEICEEFAEGKLDGFLTLYATCEMDDLRKNYKLLKGVSQNEGFELIPDSDSHPDVLEDYYYWQGFYYEEDGTLSLITLREESTHGAYIICVPNDERAEQIYEWLASVSEVWDEHSHSPWIRINIQPLDLGDPASYGQEP